MTKTLRIFTNTILLLLILQNISGKDMVNTDLDMTAVTDREVGADEKGEQNSVDATGKKDENDVMDETEMETGQIDIEKMGQRLRREEQRVALSIQTKRENSCALKVLSFYFEYLNGRNEQLHEYYNSNSRYRYDHHHDYDDYDYDYDCDYDSDTDRNCDYDSGDSNQHRSRQGQGIGEDMNGGQYLFGDNVINREELVKLIAIELTRCLFESDQQMPKLGYTCTHLADVDSGDRNDQNNNNNNSSGNNKNDDNNNKNNNSNGNNSYASSSAGLKSRLARNVNSCIGTLSKDVVLWTTFNGYLGQVDALLHRHFVELDDVRLLAEHRRLIRTLHDHLKDIVEGHAARERRLEELTLRLVRLARLVNTTVFPTPVIPNDGPAATAAVSGFPFRERAPILRGRTRLLFVCMLLLVCFAGSVFGRAWTNRGRLRHPTAAAAIAPARGWGWRQGIRILGPRGGVEKDDYYDDDDDDGEIAIEVDKSGCRIRGEGDDSFVGVRRGPGNGISLERAVLERAIALLVGAGICSILRRCYT